MASGPQPALGNAAAAEALLRDLYVTLRAALRKWSSVTRQTPQARMGYVGQHLVSVVTGLQGGRSGARGKDLIVPGGKYSEIKTCYRIDQLGACAKCAGAVASIETECPNCGSQSITRKDDSKWLIGIRNDEEMRTLFEPVHYYLVLFDFADFQNPGDILARIYRVDPRRRGFVFCLVDYYTNIKTSAPFNLWPFSLKFEMMQPCLIYQASIKRDDTISTVVFPGSHGSPIDIHMSDLNELKQVRITEDELRRVAGRFGLQLPQGQTKAEMLKAMQEDRAAKQWQNDVLADAIADEFYLPKIKNGRQWVPASLLGGPPPP